mmetsp:Transcript_2491/g.3326  ORF Transcript_2491/g.3326 Transcript_2491/m.3326 type:complete len:201 (-) Transcript_2491:472-1074(-)
MTMRLSNLSSAAYLLLFTVVTHGITQSVSSATTTQQYPKRHPQQCLSLGFDTSNLSCDTCTTILPTHPQLSLFVDDCLSCCQEWRINPYLNPIQTIKYQHAKLKYMTGMLENDLRDFAEQDIENIRNAKGNDVLTVEQVELDANMREAIMYGFASPDNIEPTSLYLYKQNEKEADKVIDLRGWKRDDLKDMLMTLLINQA